MTLYDDLELTQAASADDVKKAFRRLALQHHPDRGGDAERFKKINEAYEVLSDDKKRTDYDYKLSTPQQPSFFNAVFNNMGNIFSAMNIRFNRPRVNLPDEHFQLKIPFTNALNNGYDKRIKKTLTVMCETCMLVCTGCKGQGFCLQTNTQGNFTNSRQMECKKCCTRGMVFEKKPECSCCDQGFKKRIVDLHIILKPHECLKHKLVYHKLGAQSSTFLENDSNFIVHLEIDTGNPYLKYDPKSGDVTFTPPLKLSELIHGTKIEVPYEGLVIELKPMLLKPGLTATLDNKGLPVNESGERGKLIVCPEVDYDEELEVDLDLLKQAIKSKLSAKL